MKEKPQKLKIAINNLNLNETIWNLFIVEKYIDTSVFKIVYPHDDYFRNYGEITIRVGT